MAVPWLTTATGPPIGSPMQFTSEILANFMFVIAVTTVAALTQTICGSEHPETICKMLWPRAETVTARVGLDWRIVPLLVWLDLEQFHADMLWGDVTRQ